MTVRLLSLGLLMSGAVFVWQAPSASAATVSGPGYFNPGTTYFADPWSFGSDVISGRPGADAIPSSVYTGSNVTRKNNYLAWLAGRRAPLNTCATTRDQIGAAFIINSMLGRGPGTRTKCVTTAMWLDLVDRVNVSYVGLTAYSFDPNTISSKTSFYSTTSTDDNFYATWDAGPRPIITFYNIDTGAPLFYIEIPCGNPIGSLSLPPARRPTILNQSVTCPTRMIKGTAYDVDFPSRALTIQIIYAGSVIATVTANQSLPEFATTGGNAGHDFSYILPAGTPATQLVASGATFTIRAIGVNYAGTPDSFSNNVNVSAGPCNTGSCVSNNFPATMAVGMRYTFNTVSQVQVWGATYTTANPAIAVTVRNPSGAVVPLTTISNYTRAGSAPATLTTTHAFTPTVRGTYTMQWRLTGSGMDFTCPGSGGVPGAPADGVAGDQPYYSVVGGDILSGAGIIGYNQDNRNVSGAYPNGFAGAGSQVGALAVGNISGFVTGGGLPGGNATNTGSALALANTTKAGTTTYGGGLSAAAFPTQTTIPTGLTPTGSLGSIVNLGAIPTSGIYTVPPGATIFGTVQEGLDITLLVSGSVFISGNITYSYSSVLTVPRLNLYVNGGDIIVSGSVTEMHGVFIAQASTATNGVFYTCGINISTPVNYSNISTYAGSCSNPLTVYGAVVARQMIMGRVSGTWVPGLPNSTPSETFFYSPEIWLHRTGPGGSGTSGAPRLDSYVSLPPTL